MKKNKETKYLIIATKKPDMQTLYWCGMKRRKWSENQLHAKEYSSWNFASYTLERTKKTRDWNNLGLIELKVVQKLNTSKKPIQT